MQHRPGGPSDPAEARNYYNQLYSGAYADGWPVERYDRIKALVQSLALPPTGRALDFGCGRGALTRVLKDALPSWDVTGADLSDVGVLEAAKAHPDLTFTQLARLFNNGSKYDLVFRAPCARACDRPG